MIFGLSSADAWDRVLEDMFAEFARVAQDGFEPAVVGNGAFVKGCLLWGEGESESLGFVLAGEVSGSRGMKQRSALGDPPQIEHFLLEALVALFESAYRRGR